MRRLSLATVAVAGWNTTKKGETALIWTLAHASVRS